MKKLEGVVVLNEGNPMELGSTEHLFTVSPSTAKKNRGYCTDKPVSLTKYELKMPGVVVAQNRGMIFSSCRPVSGDYVIPELKDINLIVVDEISRKLNPVDDKNNKIYWEGKGEHVVKDVCADGQGQHWFCTKNGTLAVSLWLKLAKLGYGLKGMLQPGLATDIGAEVVDHWHVARKITLGNTMLINSSVVKGLSAYDSLEELIEHGEAWGLTTLMKQWQSGDHNPEERRIMGTQPNATNLALTKEEVENFLKPEALQIWATKFEKAAWMKAANIRTSRGRAIAARPGLMYNQLVMNHLDSKAGNMFLRLAQGKFMAEGQYLKMYMDKLVYSLVYIHGMSYSDAARKAAETGLHGEIRVNPAFAGRYYKKDENGNKVLSYKKETFVDKKGRYIETALVRYPHGAPSETIIVKAYLDETCPEDVILFPAPVADNEGNVPVAVLYAMRLQGADFDGDAVTAFTERKWIAAQKRNIGKHYMCIPVNTESTEKDKTLVTDETWTMFCEQKVASLSNRVGLIATSLKYFLSQDADLLRNEEECEVNMGVIVSHACAMGDDIDEFKHGKSTNQLVPFVVERYDGEETLSSPYFNRYACKFKDYNKFLKASFKKGKDGYTEPKKPGSGVLDMYAVAIEELMAKAGLPVVAEQKKASDGKDRWYYTVHPVQWKSKDVELHIGEGIGHGRAALPEALEKLYNVEHGTTFTAKELFKMLYRDHSAQCKALLECDEDLAVKRLIRINERYALAKVAVVSWAKVVRAIKGETLTAEEAMKVFTTLMVQHTQKSRSSLETLTQTGTFRRDDGSTYEKTEFEAMRWLNYFFDLCGDGLLLLGEEKPDFPDVASSTLAAVGAKAPDMEKARELARKEMDVIDRICDKLGIGLNAVVEYIDNNYVPAFDADDLCEEWQPSEEDLEAYYASRND